MSLKSLNLAATYSSEESSLLDDFYIPALGASEDYDRAVGYFSAGMLSYAAQGLSNFVKKKGKIRLLIGEPLSTEEYEAVRRGIELRLIEDRIFEKMSAILKHAENTLLKRRFEILSWLVAAGRMEIRFAMTDRGMFHDKMGVLTDSEGNRIVFQGSANETTAALLPDFNFESIAVYPSWKPDIFADYAVPYIDRFELIWNGDAQRVTTLDIPSRSYDCLKSFYKKSFPPEVNEPKLASYTLFLGDREEFPKIPEGIGANNYEPRLHQRQALQDWVANDYRGIMALATGSGKTITALHGATVVADYHRKRERNFVLIVSVPYQVLADQWCDVMSLFGMRPHRCYRGKQYWQTDLDQDVSSLNLHETPKFMAIVVVNATLRSDEFQKITQRIDPNDLMFVGDECHHHRNPGVLAKLPESRYRLGLSATPWRASDEQSQETMKTYYSGIISIYTIADAMRDGVLVPYKYLLHLVQLTEEESEEYQQLSDDLAPLIAARESGSAFNEELLLFLILARMRVLGSGSNKFGHLANSLAKAEKMTHCLFYCGDGSTEGSSQDVSLRDVERISLVLDKNGWKSSRFTARESAKVRSQILENFRYAYIDAVVAIRVLDEGFDMPECETAFLLASSRNERQFIQRRGRILRTAAGKKSAVIHDYVMLPGDGFRSAAFTTMVKQELVRAYEFARFANNKDRVFGVIEGICSDFDLDMDDIKYDVLMMEVRVE